MYAKRYNLPLGMPPIERGHSLPFRLSEVNGLKISQGYNGPYSHFTIKFKSGQISDKRFCLDFELPFGTDVLASCDGKVLYRNDSFSFYYEGSDIERGAKIPFNYVCIIHKGGKISAYMHLAKGGAVVDEGDYVKKGQVIAKTGKSGWVGEVPHLHYEVYDHEKMIKRTFPVEFDNYNGPLEDSILHPERIKMHEINHRN